MNRTNYGFGDKNDQDTKLNFCKNKLDRFPRHGTSGRKHNQSPAKNMLQNQYKTLADQLSESK